MNTVTRLRSRLSGSLYWLADLWDSISEDGREDTIRYIDYIVRHRHD